MSQPDDLSDAVRQALAQPAQRIQPLDLANGRRFWLKRVEEMGPILRLQKGNPERKFQAERAGLRDMAAAGMPVPEIVLEGPDYLVLPDLGTSLMELIWRDDLPEAAKIAACQGAGRALAHLHRSGLAHGRPAVRDICWDGQKASFIDLENFSRQRQGPFWQARDIVVYVHSAYVQWPKGDAWVDATLAAYAAEAPAGAMARVTKLARQLVWLGWAARAAQLVLPRHGHIRGVAPTLARLRGWDRR